MLVANINMADSHISMQPLISVHVLKMFIFTCLSHEILLTRHCFDKKSIPVLNLKQIMRRKQVNVLSNDQSKSHTCPINNATATTQTRASKINNTQYRKYQSYSDALKNSFFPRTIPPWNSLSSWMPSPQRSSKPL